MLVSNIIELAENAELKQLNIASNKQAVIGYINLGILEIHKRFNIVQKELVVNMQEDVNLYYLDGSDDNVDIDLSKHDLLMVYDAYNYDGCRIPINDEDEVNSIALPEYNLIEIPDNVLTPNQIISVIYRASPIFVTNEKDVIKLPPQFTECLLHYVGYRAHSSLRGDTKFENNAHYQRFEKSINTIKELGLYTDDSLVSHKFENRGFV